MHYLIYQAAYAFYHLLLIMPTILESIDVWNKAVQLAGDIRKLSRENGNLKNDYGIKDQIQSSVTSIASNIAESKDRKLRQRFCKVFDYCQVKHKWVKNTTLYYSRRYWFCNI